MNQIQKYQDAELIEFFAEQEGSIAPCRSYGRIVPGQHHRVIPRELADQHNSNFLKWVVLGSGSILAAGAGLSMIVAAIRPQPQAQPQPIIIQQPAPIETPIAPSPAGDQNACLENCTNFSLF